MTMLQNPGSSSAPGLLAADGGCRSVGWKVMKSLGHMAALLLSCSTGFYSEGMIEDTSVHVGWRQMIQRLSTINAKSMASPF